MSKYTIKYSGRFKKAYKRCIKRGCDPELFKTVVKILSEKGLCLQNIDRIFYMEIMKAFGNVISHQTGYWYGYRTTMSSF